MDSEDSHAYQNPLGFTKEMASIFTGFNSTDLSELRKNEICHDDLMYLSDEDLILLNVGDKFDFKSFGKMRDGLKKKFDTRTRDPMDVLKIVANSSKQLNVIQLYYRCILSVSYKLNDYYIDNNSNLRISDALICATDSLLDDLENLKQSIEYFQPTSDWDLKTINHNEKLNVYDEIDDDEDEEEGLNYTKILRWTGVGILSGLIIIKFCNF